MGLHVAQESVQTVDKHKAGAMKGAMQQKGEVMFETDARTALAVI